MHQHILQIFTLSMIKILKPLTSRPFFNVKSRALGKHSCIIYRMVYKKPVTQILRSEDTLRSENFVPLKSVIPHKC